ncbi:Protein of unknown function DUF4508, partial [Trinorchestia longiramus]
MPQHHTTGDQVQFVGEWFRSWSEMQRSDFLPSLVKELRPSHHMNGNLHECLGNLALAGASNDGASSSNRPPSIFNCQVKLFHDWVVGWSSEERAKLLMLLREADSSFGETLDAALAVLDGSEGAGVREGPEGREVPPHDDAPPLAPAAQENEGPAAAAAPAPAVAARAVGDQAAVDSDVDEAIDSSPPSTLSSPNPADGRADSGLDSPADNEPEGEDEGGHVVVVDDAAAALAVAGGE